LFCLALEAFAKSLVEAMVEATLLPIRDFDLCNDFECTDVQNPQE
jgi:hypothetical protein